MHRETKIFIWAALIGSVLLNVFLYRGITRGTPSAHDTIVQVDTIIEIDTIIVREPVVKKEIKVRVDTVYLASVDTLVKVDSVQVAIPITQKHYKDPVYDIWVSGYKPKLDSVSLYCERSAIYHTTTVYRPPKIVLSVGPYVGYGNKGWNYGVAVNLGVPINIIKQHTKKRVGTEVYK